MDTLSYLEVSKREGAEPNTHSDLIQFMTRGGFPELWRNPKLSSEDYLRSYLVTYLEKDVRQILNVTSLRDFERFIRLCASRNSQLLDKSDIASAVGVSAKTISAWLSVLEASNQIFFLEPWFGNFGKRLVKNPKLYFCDTGLACFLTGLNASNIMDSPFLGAIWENLVINEIRKTLMIRSPSTSLWFYRDNQGREVDALLIQGSHTRLIECKWTEIPNPKDFKALKEVMTLGQEKKLPEFTKAESHVVCRTKESYPFDSSASVSSLHKLLSEL